MKPLWPAILAVGTACINLTPDTGAARATEAGTAEAGAAPAQAAEGAEPAPKKATGRSYDNPEAAMSAEERGDILAICAALVQADRERMTRQQESHLYNAIKPDSGWGKLMVKHLMSDGRAKAGHRVARLLATEDMKWASRDCRTVLKKYGHTYQ